MVINGRTYKKTIKKSIGALVFIVIIMTLFVQSAYAKKYQYSSSRNISIEWRWDQFQTKANATNNLNINLAKAAAYLCKGTYGGTSDIKNRIKTLGFSNISTVLFTKYNKDNQANTSPIAFGSKVAKINKKKHLIVVVAIRGTLLKENGWDFITDLRSGVFNADGFFDAGETGRKDTENYIRKQQKKYKMKKKNTVVFITGHSLGAAVAGQIAKALQGKYANKGNIYCYTFASPFYKTYGNEKSYTNIHNFVNTEDGVPKFPLGGKRNGVDHLFTGNGDSPLGQHDVDVYLDGVITYFKDKSNSTGGGYGRGDTEKKSITLNKKQIKIVKGGQFRLSATVTGMKNKVTWTTSNNRVATVKGGAVTGKKKGTATITAKCGKLKATCKVTISSTKKTSSTANDATRKNVKVYDNILKKGEMVYCVLGNTDNCIVSVDLKNGKTREYFQNYEDVKYQYVDDEDIITHCIDGIHAMTYKDGYIYFLSYAGLWRLKLSTKMKYHHGNYQLLTYLSDNKQVKDYAIIGNKIYYRLAIESEDGNRILGYKNMVMELNGRSKKETNVKISMKTAKSNVKGYSTYGKVFEKKGYYYVYLKTPKKKYRIFKGGVE